MNRQDLLDIVAEHVENDQVVTGDLPDGTPYRGRLHYRFDADRVVVSFEANNGLDPNYATFELN